jgi:hypothetical protein
MHEAAKFFCSFKYSNCPLNPFDFNQINPKVCNFIIPAPFAPARILSCGGINSLAAADCFKIMSYICGLLFNIKYLPHASENKTREYGTDRIHAYYFSCFPKTKLYETIFRSIDHNSPLSMQIKIGNNRSEQ